MNNGDLRLKSFRTEGLQFDDMVNDFICARRTSLDTVDVVIDMY